MSWVDVTLAVATTAAAGVALGLGGLAERRANRTERRQRELEERRQAIHVAAWMSVKGRDQKGKQVEVDPGIEVEDQHVIETQTWVVIQNASDEPIWDVTIFTPGFVRKNKDSRELEPINFEDELVCVGPHETVRSPVTALTLNYNRLPVVIHFRDNAGRDQSRDERGRLHRGRTSRSFWADIDEFAKKGEKDQHPSGPRLPSLRRALSRQEFDGDHLERNKPVWRDVTRGVEQ